MASCCPPLLICTLTLVRHTPEQSHVCICSSKSLSSMCCAADKAQTGERSRNIDGTLSGADRSTASDAEFWNQEDVYRCFDNHCMSSLPGCIWCLLLQRMVFCRRMDFSLKCAYAHGTSAVRTHLINMAPKQIQLTWPCFQLLKEKWKGKVHPHFTTPRVWTPCRSTAATPLAVQSLASTKVHMPAATMTPEQTYTKTLHY